MPVGKTGKMIGTPPDRVAGAPDERCRPILFIGAALAAMAMPIDIAGHGHWITLKSAFASHDKANDNGRGHSGDSGGAGGAGNGHGGGTGDDQDDGPGSRDAGESGSGGGRSAEAAAVENEALGEAVGAVETAGRTPADSVTTGLPTIRDIFALSEDAVVGVEEERALIASGWNAR